MFFIKSMSKDMPALRQKFESGNNVREDHFLKLYFYPQAENEKRGWMQSVYASCNRSYTLSNTKRLPPFKLILDLTWGEDFSDTLDDPLEVAQAIKNIKHEVTEYPSLFEPFREEWGVDFYNKFKDYHIWLAGQLSKVKRLNREECFAKIEELLSKSVFLEYVKGLSVASSRDWFQQTPGLNNPIR